MTSRLHALDASRSRRLSASGARMQRKAAHAVVVRAGEATSAHHRLDLLAALEAGQYGDGPLRSAIDQARRDVRANARHDETLYRLACAYGAAWWALDPDPEVASQQAVYLASFAVPDGSIALVLDDVLTVGVTH
ncbi:hypothetical protein [Fodinicola feengrottensis]|uniref:Uncharacterized protein n=1 Tax=Fodinicola feengrottensis TaxID=435914 RepID=A0ABP4VBP2_9ACTN|nr:hypothetical protein [Fodinicola feengrottensis]